MNCTAICRLLEWCGIRRQHKRETNITRRLVGEPIGAIAFVSQINAENSVGPNLRVQPHAERVGCNAGLGGFLPTIRPWSTCLQCGGIFLKPLIIMPTDLR